MEQDLIPLKLTKLTSSDDDGETIIKALKDTKTVSTVFRNYLTGPLNKKDLPKNLKNYPKSSKTVRFQVHCNSSAKLVKGLIKRGEAQKSPIKFLCSFYYSSSFQTAYFFSKLRSYTSLSFLELYFCTSFNRDAASEIGIKRLSSLKNLSHFSTDFSDGNFKDPTTLGRLFRCLFSLKKLARLSLYFSLCQEFKSAQLNLLSSYLKKLSKLRALNLRFCLLKGFDDTAIYNLASALSNLRVLSQFSLYLGELDTLSKYPQKRLIQNSSTLLQFFKSLGESNALSDLSIDFSGCTILIESDKDPITEGLSYLRNLPIETLRLSPYKDFTNRDLMETFQILKRFRFLTALYFGLDECGRITPQGLFNFSFLLSELLSLSSLELSLNCFYDAFKDAIQDVLSAIKRLENLTELCLWLSGPYTTSYSQINRFSLSLKGLRSLKNLSLEFDYQEHLSDFAMFDLSEYLKDLIRLKRLSLSFEKTVDLTNLGILHLACAIQKLEDLRNLSLDFGSNREIDEESVEGILQSLLCLPCLENLSLLFSGCSLIVEAKEVLLHLFKTIKQKKKNCKIYLRPKLALAEENFCD